ncbi:uncharacterized protein EURHEDRAFT_493704 [Aspergillus ruber CBS 135680]|uniref:RRM domain-containing protein n=1 Tax=Aspergillus ruber (strain CBS 135680) TaxID=1388766 RepID=A0A017SNJ0_ASPRC|nr:uncharacterized protein EURHEDRAFT_493704 [Aspergillus ruber CBS 135680]EYE97845.1 hypothetical protein EURHEDRAFT_493704 [Aspergillus ruber CBS 135680]
MAPDKKVIKRKAAAAGASDSPAKKTKKVEPQPSEAPKAAPKSALKNKKNAPAAKDTKSDAAPKTNGEKEQSKRQIKPRKRAADFLSSDEEDEPEVKEAEPEKKKSTNKKTKKEEAPKAEKASTKSKAKKQPTPEESEEEANASAPEGSDDEGEDDQTTALIRGFESSGDEDASDDEGFDPKQPVPNIPDSKKAKRKILKKQKKAAEEGENQTPGTVYIGRIPHGFYEYQMRAYFSQFGEITRLRLSRNRITGRSKHYAFVEFASSAVARIAAETMDNYLMFGHILKCKYIPSEQLHPDIWKGANRRFKRTPWNKIEKKRLEKGKTREQWTDRIEKEQKKRLAKAEKLKAVGYEVELPELMDVDEVPVQEEPKAIEDSKPAEEPVKAIEEPVKTIEEPKETETKKENDNQKKTKKEKKEKKVTQPAAEKEASKTAEEVKEPKKAEPAAAKTGAKAKKADKKKTKAKA